MFSSNISEDDANRTAITYLNGFVGNLFSTGKAVCGDKCSQPFSPSLSGTCPNYGTEITSGIGFSQSICVYDCKDDKFILAITSDSHLFIVNPSTDSISQTTDIALSINGIVYVPTTNEIYVTVFNDNNVRIYDAKTLAFKTQILLFSDNTSWLMQGVFMASNGLVAIPGLANVHNLNVCSIDPSTRSIIQTTTSDDAGYVNGGIIAFNSDNGMIYFMGAGSSVSSPSRIAEINPVGGGIINHIDIVGLGAGIAFSENDHCLYCNVVTSLTSDIHKLTAPLSDAGVVKTLANPVQASVSYDEGRKLVWISDFQPSNLLEFFGSSCPTNPNFAFLTMEFSPSGKSYIQKTNGNFAVIT